jgi:hypothetical protein
MVAMWNSTTTYIYSWIVRAEKLIYNLDDVEQNLASVDQELETLTHATLSIWQKQDSPEVQLLALAKRLEECQNIVRDKRDVLSSTEEGLSLIRTWKKLSDLDVQLLLYRQRLETILETCNDTNRKMLFQKLFKTDNTPSSDEESMERKMRLVSFEEAENQKLLFTKHLEKMSVKPGRTLKSTLLLSRTVSPFEGITKKLQTMEELLDKQIPQVCRAELFCTVAQSAFYEKKLEEIKIELQRLKSTLAESTEMSCSDTKLEALLFKVENQVAFFTDLCLDYAPVATAQQRLFTCLHRDDLQLLDAKSALKTYFIAKDLFNACLAAHHLAHSHGKGLYFTYKQNIVTSLQQVLAELCRQTTVLDSSEEELHKEIVNGITILASSATEAQNLSILRLKSLLLKLAVDYLANTVEAKVDKHPILTIILFLSMKRDNALRLQKIRDEDPEFSQSMDFLGWNGQIQSTLARFVPNNQANEAQVINMIKNRRAQQLHFDREYVQWLDNRSPLSRGLIKLFK